MPDPVLFVPGLPASNLRDTSIDKRFFVKPLAGFNNPLFRGPNDPAVDDGVREDGPIHAAIELGPIDIAKQAATLYKKLKKLGIDDPVKFGWDWRRSVYDSAFNWGARPRLARAIRDLRQATGERVTVIVHSTGGLALRSCLEADQPLAASIRRVIAFGVPWAGTPQSMLYINGQSGFAVVVPPEKAQDIICHSWAAFDLFPPDPTHLADENGDPLNLTYRQQGNVRTQASALVDTAWINSLPSAALQAAANDRTDAAGLHLGVRRPTIDLGGRSLEIVNVAGWGYTTPVAARLSGAGANGAMHVEEDREDDTLDGGDGTVPRKSAAWLAGGDNVRVSTYNIPIGVYPHSRKKVHKALWSNPGSINLLNHLLRGDTLKDFCYAAIDADDWMPGGSAGGSVRIRCVALDGAGAPLDDALVRTLNYDGNVVSRFDPARHGRHLLTLDRSRIPRSSNGAVRRLRLRIEGVDHGREVRQTRAFQMGP